MSSRVNSFYVDSFAYFLSSSIFFLRHRPCILVFDSLAGASRARIIATLRDYLRVEYKAKHNEERDFSKLVVKGACPRVPQQNNYTDCGLFVLQYVESFFEVCISFYHASLVGSPTYSLLWIHFNTAPLTSFAFDIRVGKVVEIHIIRYLTSFCLTFSKFLILKFDFSYDCLYCLA